LIEVVNKHPRGKEIGFNIEIKSEEAYDGIYTPDYQQFAELVMAVITSHGIKERATIQSFDVRPLQYIHAKDTSFQLVFLVENHDGFEKNMEKLGFTPDVYSPNFAQVKPKLVKACHDLNMLIIPWTVNERAIAKTLIAMGVDGIITDYPSIHF
jgi:glycerophosphoryl diester phosphodiesterase